MEKEENKNEESRGKWLILFIVIVVILFLIFGCSDKNKNVTEIRSDQEFSENEVDKNEEKKLTPEEVIAELDRAEGIGVEQGPIEVEIISPEEKSFMPRQARFYRAEIKGIKTGSKCSCDWKFYLNENNEEVLYKEMNDRWCTSRADVQIEDPLYTCGFTSTFIDRTGELRVEVEVEVEKQGEVVESNIAEKKYIVE